MTEQGDTVDQAPTREELDARLEAQGESYWDIVRAQFKRNHQGMVGLAFIALIVVVALLAPLIANDRPVVCKYKGDVQFPAFATYVDNWVPWQSLRYDLQSWEMTDGYFPFSAYYPELDKQTWKEAQANEPEAFEWAIWPPVPWNPSKFDETAIKTEPSMESGHLLGTDDQGRDVLSRIIHGCVVAIIVGVVAMSIATALGVVLGLLAGYLGGWTDMVLSRIVEVVMCFPTFFLIIAVISFLEKSIVNIMVVIGFVRWTGIFRLIRGEAIACRGKEYIVAARATGTPLRTMLFRHLLPNTVTPVFVSVAFGIASAVLMETSLSFLGFGDTSVPSWGEIVSQGRQYTAEGLTHLVIWPGVAIFVTLTAFNLFGQGLRDAMDPRLRR